jgi:outer membrane protein assembly factor BamD
MRCNWLIPIFFVLLLTGCGLLPDQEDETADWTASQLYYEAKENLDEGDYENAIELYEKLMARYPFGRFAQQAQIEVAYAYYRYEEPEQAIAAADRFIKLHPKHPNVDYVYYLKGLANFNRGYGLLERFIPTDSAQRDQRASIRSFYDFEELLKNYPDSKYAEDARLRMLYLRNNIADYELAVAQYYMRRGAHVAALNRGSYIVEHYQRTPAVPEALEVMAAAYRAMGMEELAADTDRVYAVNYAGRPKEDAPDDSPFWWPFE